MKAPRYPHIVFLLVPLCAWGQPKAEQDLHQIGGAVFRKGGHVVEINLSGTRCTDAHLALVAGFPKLTDLSLESTIISDAGIAHLAGLDSLEWLNLYRTNVGDAGLKHLSRLPALKLLPVGKTRVTDKGLAHLAG